MDVLPFLALLVAHQFEHPKVLRAGFKEDRLLLAVNYDVNPGRDARQIRALFDRDADGAMSEKEQAKLTAYLEQMSDLFFELTIDGKKVKPSRVNATPHRIDLPVTAPDTLGVALLYSAPLPAKRTIRVRIEDRARDPAKHVPVVVDLAEGWEVRFASQGELSPSPLSLSRIRLQKGRPLILTLRRP